MHKIMTVHKIATELYAYAWLKNVKSMLCIVYYNKKRKTGRQANCKAQEAAALTQAILRSLFSTRPARKHKGAASVRLAGQGTQLSFPGDPWTGGRPQHPLGVPWSTACPQPPGHRPAAAHPGPGQQEGGSRDSSWQWALSSENLKVIVRLSTPGIQQLRIVLSLVKEKWMEERETGGTERLGRPQPQTKPQSPWWTALPHPGRRDTAVPRLGGVP